MPTISSLIHALLDQAFNEGNHAILDELVPLDAVTYLPGWGMPSNRLGLKQMIIHLRAAFPDLTCTVDDEIEGESKLAVLWTLRGTHKGSFFGNVPTGRSVAVHGFIFIRTADGRISENWLLIDQMGLLQQLGIVPPPRGKT
ncbi:MAG: ester cyclase [Ardenticatenaceae bacterium]|nr:ester cyclase [Ardenticatenaceae bacterium]